MVKVAKIETIRNSRNEVYYIKSRACSWGFHGCAYYIYEGARVDKLYDLFTALGAKCEIIKGTLKYSARGKGKLQRMLFKFNRYAGISSVAKIIDTSHEALQAGCNPVAALILGHYIGGGFNGVPAYYLHSMDIFSSLKDVIYYVPKNDEEFLTSLRQGSVISSTFKRKYDRNLYNKLVELVSSKNYKEAEKLITL